MNEADQAQPAFTPPRRIEVARMLAHPQHLRASIGWVPPQTLQTSMLAGMQAALAMVIALTAFHLSPWADLTGYAGLGAMAALLGRFAPVGRRNRIVLLAGLCQTFAVLAMSLLVWSGVPEAVALLALALACGGFYFITVTAGFGPPGALIFVFATGAAMHPADSLEQALARGAATAVVAVLALAICALTERFRPSLGAAGQPLPVEQRPPLRLRLIAAGRILSAAVIAGFISHALGAQHPVWATMGALVVLQGTHLHLNMNRALQRMAGTTVGAVLAWLVLMQEPSFAAIVAMLALCQFLAEVVIGSNYALGQIFVTPMALLMSSLGLPAGAGLAMAPERVLDTLLGVSIGMAIAVILSSVEDRHRLAQHHTTQTAG